jgi:hypothetical protein
VTRPPTARRAWWGAVVLCLVVDAAFLAEGLFLPDRVRAPADLIPAIEPLSGAQEAPRPHNLLLSDWPREFHPWHVLVRQAYREGRVPLWNEKNGFGAPLAANMQCEAFSPYLPLLIVFGDDYADVKQLAQMVLAQLFSLALARALGLPVAAALVVALGYSFSSYMQAWAVHPHPGSAAFTPAILFLLVLLRRRATLARFACAAACVGFAVLAGHLETAVMAGLSGTLIALLHRPKEMSGWREAGRFLGVATATGAAGLLVAAIVLLPFFDYLDQSEIATIRMRTPSTPLPVDHLRTLLDPYALGHPTDPARPYVGSHNFVEGVLFIGRFAILLAAIGIVLGLWRRRTYTLPLLVTTILALAVSYAPPKVYDVLKSWPVLDRMPIVRFNAMAILPLLLFSGMGLDFVLHVVRRFAPRLAVWIAALAAIGIVAGEGLVTWYRYVPVVGKSNLHPSTPFLTEVRERTAGSRTLPLGHLLMPEVNALAGIPSMRSFDAMGFGRHTQLIHESGAFYGVTFAQAAVFCEPKVLDLCAVRYVLSRWNAADSVRPALEKRVVSGAPFADGFAAPKGHTLELVVHRAPGAGVRDGTITLSFESAGEPPLEYTIGKDVAVDTHARLGRFKDQADAPVQDLLSINYKGFSTHYVAFTFAADGVPVTMKAQIAPGGAPATVMLLARGGLGQDIHELAREGPFRLSERRTALPRAYFVERAELVSGVHPESGVLNAVKRLFAADFDPHASVVLEREDGEITGALEAASAPASAPLARTTPVEIKNETPELVRLALTAPRAGYVVLADSAMRGWECTLDGVQVPWRAANAIGRAVAVGPGAHEIVMSYRPMAFTAGASLSLATLLLLVVLLIVGGVRSRRRP